MENNFRSHFFNKDLKDLTYFDIEQYFTNPQEESSTLEFKSGEVEINDVFKEIAAFLNTEGGLLIIGAPREIKENKGKRNYSYCQGALTYSKFAGKDWLNQKIFSNITPSPINIFIKEIITENGNIFVLNIPQSSTPPHQSNADGRYYIRIDNEAKPAPHGLIQALFDKRRKPKLAASVTRSKITSNKDEIHVLFRNDSPVPAEKLNFLIDVYNVHSQISEIDFREKIIDNDAKQYIYSDQASQILVSSTSMDITFNVVHLNMKYAISASYWCRDTDFDSIAFIIDPTTDSITSETWAESKVFLNRTEEASSE